MGVDYEVSVWKQINDAQRLDNGKYQWEHVYFGNSCIRALLAWARAAHGPYPVKVIWR